MENKENIQKNREQRKFKNILQKHKKKIFMFLLLCIIIYVIFIVVQLIKNPTDTVYVEMGQIQEEETQTGYIVRDEAVLKGEDYKNGIEQIKSEGEKVAKGEAIFRYYKKNEDNLVKKIQELDKKIDKAMSEEEGLFTSDTKVLEEQIDTKVDELFGESDLAKIQENKQQILNNMTKKAQIAGELSPSGSYLKKLIDERKKYETKLNSGSEYLKATKSGIVSYRVDGFEEILKPEEFGKYSKSFLEDLKLRAGQIIPASSESGKIIDNYYCYIISILDSEYAKKAKIGDKVTIRLPSGNEVNAIIEYKTEEKNDYVITFKLEKGVEELINYRKFSVGIIWWNASGLRVPNTALSYEDKNGEQIAYVTRTRIGYEDKILVKILKSNDKYSIVANYTSEELRQMGYTSSEIQSKPQITIYDEIIINK